MALDLTPEQKAQGKQNFDQAAGDLERLRRANGKDDPTRRTFMKSALAAGAVVPVSAAVYFGYDAWKGNKAVRLALIGCGDEGGVLVGDHNPEYTQIVAVCDVRPSNLERIFTGDLKPDGTPNPDTPRKGLNKIYGAEEAKKIKTYDDLDKLLADKTMLGLDGVIVATPLVTHRPIVEKCLDAGLHVLCEKLMARTVEDCKAMIRKAKEKGLLLSIGHQRHYSMLYAHALEVVQSGILGDVKHIRALWHRNNTSPRAFSKKDLAEIAPGTDLPMFRDTWYPPILKKDAEALPADRLKALGFDTIQELIRWRTYNKTGGGLMAELGSHQLDAASIFLGKVKPLSVVGTGMRSYYGTKPNPTKRDDGWLTDKNPRECHDGVFVTFEFPGAEHPAAGKGGKNDDDIVMVTYSSFSTNGFEKYGECIMGSKGTLITEEERDVYLFKEGGAAPRDTGVTVTGGGDKKPALEAAASSYTGGGAAISKGSTAPKWDSDVRGYRTEFEHFAYCIRRWQELKQQVSYEKKDGKWVHADILPRCHGEIAMADAILALTANMSMNKRIRIDFDKNWFDPDSKEVPETKYGLG